MKTKIVALSLVLVSSLAVFTYVYAGSLSPLSSPASTSYTLTNIYTRLTTNATAVEGSHSFTSPGSVASSGYTLKQIYDAIPTIDPTRVLVGTTYLSVAGTANKYMWNGTGSGYTGGSQANGGVDDFNNYGAPATSRYSNSWTQCTAGNTYCGTSSTGAAYKDNATGLVWSYPCNGTGCSSFSDSSPASYSWDSSSGTNGGRTASQLCSDKSGWSLPHQKQLMVAYVDGSYGTLETQGVFRNYWSATTVSYGPTYVWYVGLSDGSSYTATKPTVLYVRCVQAI